MILARKLFKEKSLKNDFHLVAHWWVKRKFQMLVPQGFVVPIHV
jgi:hypothetical protein